MSDVANNSGRAALRRRHEAQDPNPLQLQRLAALSGIVEADLAHKSIAVLKDELVEIVPIWFDFVFVCGHVVKVDPKTGLKYPVIGATVDVYDVDCDWLWYFPQYWPWSWGFRYRHCSSEKLATVVTDSCGKFCALVPRFDIEWIRLWRRERLCFPEIMRRPSVIDVVSVDQAATKPGPSADAATVASRLGRRDDLKAAIGRSAFEVIRDAARTRTVGSSTSGLANVLAANAFTGHVPAPVPAELRSMSPAAAHRELADRLGLESEHGQEFHLSKSYGPFRRCIDIEVPLWLPIFSVPDIAFVVTQDIHGDGTQHVIYDGGFDADWDAWPATNIELGASSIAVASPFPGCAPSGVPCGDQPAITQLSWLDINANYLDSDSGFAVRMNQPSAAPMVPSTAPLEGSMHIIGCAPGASYYRVLAQWADSDGLTTIGAGNRMTPLPASAFGAWTPITASPWQVALGTSLSPPIVADADGWYPTTYLSWEPANLLVPWTPADGVYRLAVEVGEGTPGSITVTGASGSTIPVVVDSSFPHCTFAASGWSSDGGVTWQPITDNSGCLLIERVAGTPIQVRLTYNVTAKHLYSVSMAPDGCDNAVVSPTPGQPAPPNFVYDNPFDNSASGIATYSIDGAAPEGCYSWVLDISSRAFSPDDSAGQTLNGGFAWNYTKLPIYITPTVTIAVANL